MGNEKPFMKAQAKSSGFEQCAFSDLGAASPILRSNKF
jgi:hypothetical protein